MKIKKISLVVKAIVLQIIFIVLHYSYDWFPNNFTALCSGINESVYQHMKIGYFSYVLFALMEFILIRQAIHSFDRYIYARLFSATYFPLVMMVIYLLGPLTFGHTESMLVEIIFANAALLATSVSTLIVEGHIEASKPKVSFRVLTIALFVLSFAQFIVFTFDIPWFDIFAIPPGW